MVAEKNFSFSLEKLSSIFYTTSLKTLRVERRDEVDPESWLNMAR
jgi:hypothetical protein